MLKLCACMWVQRVVIVSIVTFPFYGLVMGGGGCMLCVCVLDQQVYVVQGGVGHSLQVSGRSVTKSTYVTLNAAIHNLPVLFTFSTDDMNMVV
jgi:hypothetical protein